MEGFWEFARAFLGAGVGSALVTGGISLWQASGKRTADATYLGMRLAVVLEAFASDCARLIEQNANADHLLDEPTPNWSVDLPPLGVFPKDGDG